jgi:hypothetical protein
MHGNEQIINELLGKYVHRLNKSTRQQFLVNLAARRCDDDSDSDSEGSSVVNEFGDIDNIASSSSSVVQVKVIPQPPRCVALVAPTDDASPEPSHLLQHRSPHKGSKVDPVSKTAKEQQLVTAVIPRVNSSPLLRRAESFRRKAPAAKEGIEARQHEANLSSISSDAIARRPVHQLPTRSALDLKLSKSLSMRSSVYSEADDDISVAASVMSTASIQSALYSTPSTTSTDSQLNVGSNHCYYTQSRREYPPRLPMRGSYVHTSSTKSKRFDVDDTSTVTTEATSMYGSISLSRSMSFESATSFEVLQEVKSKNEESVSSSKVSLPKSSRRSELERLKKLTHIRPMNSESNGSNQKKSLNNIMLTQIDRAEPVMEEKESKPVVPMKSSLKDLKSKRYGLGRVSVSKDTMSVASDWSDSIATASDVSRTYSTCSTVEIEKLPMTAVSKRALLRRHSSSTARARSATRTSSIAEDIGKLTQVQVVDNANTSQPVVARARPQSMSPLRTASTRVGSPIVDRKDITNRLPNHCIVHKKSEEEKEDVMTSVSVPSVSIETKSSSSMSSRAERRRSRSVSRSRVSQSSVQSSRSSSTLRTTPAPSTLRSDPGMGTPPRISSKRLVDKTSSIHMATPPKMLSRTAAPDAIVARSNSPSPMRTSLMKSALIMTSC